MKIHAYHEMYLSKAQSVLGNAFDYAVNDCNMLLKDFVKLFLVSSVSKKIENGEPNYLVGKSGIDLVREIIYETTKKEIEVKANENYIRTADYWIGWAIAYYQWYSDRKFFEIFNVVTIEDLQMMYYPLHEADISKFVDIMEDKLRNYYNDTNLKRIRNSINMTQRELSELSGISLRSIQMYEQKNKDINKASVKTVYKLAKILGCTIENLIEK